ncbi:hypothetical protein [Metabacillus idriensis]|uniref:hypothetical protein n=1 Tax=Metabacillus idriensis TaxID=324768 RepID=UPI0017487DA5|nr:hypothetical protein [Metabacillus idriensis]
MKKMNQDGYALLNVILVFTIVTIAGLALLASVVSSRHFVAYSETYTEELAEAEKTMETATAELEHGIETINNRISSINIQTLPAEINSLQNTLDAKSTEYAISIQTVKDLSETNKLFLRKAVIEVPVGTSKRKSIKKTITISTFPDVFRHSVVTEGNLTLNGAVDIKGDLFVNRTVNISHAGKFSTTDWWGNETVYRPSTTYPSIEGNLTVKGINGGTKYYTGVEPNFSPIQSNQNITDYFTKAPTFKDRNVSFNQFNINQLINEKKGNFYSLYNKVRNVVEWGSVKNNTVINQDILFNNKLNLSSNRLTIKGDLFLLNGLNIDQGGKLTVEGNLYIYNNGWLNSNSLTGTIELTKRNNYMYIQGNSNIKDLTFNGQMFSNGEISISDNLSMNGTMYVSENVSIRNLSNQSGGTAVILSEGNIQVANNNVYERNIRVLDAFLYSNKDLEIYGVGSNMKIRGGIYGRNIKLNATKGETYPKDGYSNYVQNLDLSRFDSIGYLYIQKKQQNPSLKSRLQIEFKPDLILNPPVGIPTVENLQFTEIDQKIE